MGDNQSTLPSSTSLNVLAGRGQIKNIKEKYEHSDDKERFIDEMCSCDNVYNMFPVDMAIHNNALESGFYLLSKGSVYFSNLYTTSFIDNSLTISMDDFDSSQEIPIFTMIIGDKMFHTIEELNEIVDNNSDDVENLHYEKLIEMTPTLLQFCKATLKQNDSQTYYHTKASCLLAKKTNLLIREVIEFLEEVKTAHMKSAS